RVGSYQFPRPFDRLRHHVRARCRSCRPCDGSGKSLAGRGAVGDVPRRVRRALAWRLPAAGGALPAAATIGASARTTAAQPDPRIPWIGYLANEPSTDSAPVLREALRERDWVEGQSIKIWYRYAQGRPDLYPLHADDLVRLNVAAIVAVGP